MTWTYQWDPGFVKIYCGELLHLALKRSKYLGFQAWVEDRPGPLPAEPSKTWFCVEFYLEGQAAVLCEYDTRQKWEGLLRLLDKYNLT